MQFAVLMIDQLKIHIWQIIHQSKVDKVRKTNTYDSNYHFETVRIYGKE